METDLDGLCCPLTLEWFVEPVILSGDGHTYERAAIRAWLDTGKLTSPTTGAPLGAGGAMLIVNHAVKKTIAELDSRRTKPVAREPAVARAPPVSGVEEPDVGVGPPPPPEAATQFKKPWLVHEGGAPESGDVGASGARLGVGTQRAAPPRPGTARAGVASSGDSSGVFGGGTTTTTPSGATATSSEGGEE